MGMEANQVQSTVHTTFDQQRGAGPSLSGNRLIASHHFILGVRLNLARKCMLFLQAAHVITRTLCWGWY
jgi:hypothetical protein